MKTILKKGQLATMDYDELRKLDKKYCSTVDLDELDENPNCRFWEMSVNEDNTTYTIDVNIFNPEVPADPDYFKIITLMTDRN